jgi:hypothetical protein
MTNVVSLCLVYDNSLCDGYSFCAADENPRQFLRMNEDELEQTLQTVRDPHLKHTLSFGIGLHHAGLTEHVLESNRLSIHFLSFSFSFSLSLSLSLSHLHYVDIHDL